MAANNELMHRLNFYKKDICTIAQDLIIHGVPSKVMETQIFSNGPKVTQELVVNEEGICVLIPHIQVLPEMIESIKKSVNQALKDITTLKMWLNIILGIDGPYGSIAKNDPSKLVHKRLVGQIESFEGEMEKHLNKTTSFYEVRSAALAKFVDLPSYGDPKHIVGEFEDKEFHRLKMVMIKIRDMYIVIQHIIAVNLHHINF